MMTREDQIIQETEVLRQYKLEKHSLYKKRLQYPGRIGSTGNIDSNRYLQLKRQINSKSISVIRADLLSGSYLLEELLTYYLQRIKLYDAKFNAVISLNPNLYTEAMLLEALPHQKKMQLPLYGIPIMLKDNIGTGQAMPTTAGAKALEYSMSISESPLVGALKSKGALILGKANLSEWAFFMSSDGVSGYSALGGQTHNPYGEFDVGGSSSGSAVAVALNYCAAAVGTETYGSITCPGSQNSVVGLKPTHGLINADLVIPIARLMDVAGPLARTIDDARLILACMQAGENFLTGNSLCSGHNSATGIRIGVPRCQALDEMNRADDEQVMDKAMAAFREAGITVDSVSINNQLFSIDLEALLIPWFKYELNYYLANSQRGAHVKNLSDLIAYNEQNSENLAPYGQDLLEKAALNCDDYLEAKRILASERNRCSLALDSYFESCDLILTLGSSFSQIYCLSGYPALTLPGCYRSCGEPVGITLIGKAYSESMLLHVGAIIESALSLEFREPVLEGEI
jgi:amidase